jgi:hypothetical protein
MHPRFSRNVLISCISGRCSRRSSKPSALGLLNWGRMSRSEWYVSKSLVSLSQALGGITLTPFTPAHDGPRWPTSDVAPRGDRSHLSTQISDRPARCFHGCESRNDFLPTHGFLGFNSADNLGWSWKLGSQCLFDGARELSAPSLQCRKEINKRRCKKMQIKYFTYVHKIQFYKELLD